MRDFVILDLNFCTLNLQEIIAIGPQPDDEEQLWSYTTLKENPAAQTIIDLINAIVSWLHRSQKNKLDPENG